MVPLYIKGVAVKVHPLFILTLVLLATVGRFFEGLAVFGLVILHELAHILAAGHRGMTPRQISLLPVGGVVLLDGLASARPRDEAFVALAGPVLNLVLAAPAFILWAAGRPSWWLLRIAGFSLVMGLFNLLPALPMDGGRVLRAFLAGRLGRGTATRWLNLVGLALISGLFGAGALLVLMNRANLTLLAVSTYLFAGWQSERRFEVFDWAQEMLAKKRRLEASAGKPLKAKLYVIGPSKPLAELLRLCRPSIWCQFRVYDGAVLWEFSERDAFEILVRKGYHAQAKDACMGRGRTITSFVEKATSP